MVAAGLTIAGILTTSAVAEAQARTHLVRAGDTLGAIADRYDVTVEQLRGWNGLQGDLIVEGRELVVRADEPEAGALHRGPGPEPAMQIYVVAASDTLSCIAARHGVSLDELAAANRLLDTRRIRAGQRLVIPSRAGDWLASAGGRHVVTVGDTLESIAAGLGVTVADLSEWNPGLDPDRLRPGQVIAFRPARQAVHEVARGETLSEIAERYGVTVADMVRWNEGLDPERIAIGQRLMLRVRRSATESVGAPTCGRLVDGRQVPTHPGYVIRNPERSWATDETIEHLVAAFDGVLLRHPNANRVRVHDLSLEGGGPIDDHRSHQSGRDVDLTYYQRACPDRVCNLQHVLPRQLDLGPQWTLLEHWLRSGSAQRIFIDYGLQEVLYNYARRHGATRRELEAWFQYPRGWSADVGVVRHFPNHGNHVHVRFVCPEGDDHCQ